jgi:signal transduction histidine kinase
VLRLPAATEPAGVHPLGNSSTPFGPTSLDRLVDRIQPAAPRLSRVSDLLLIGVTALLAVVDVAVWGTDPVLDTGRLPTWIALLVPCVGALASLAVSLRRQHLALAVVGLAGTSLVLTIASLTVGASLPPSFAALLALALLTTGVLRHTPGGAAVVLTTLAALAVAAEALRPMVSTAGYLLVVCEGAFGAAVGVGVYLRWSDWRRIAAEAAARTDERLEIARELHDLVGHYVTGIVVQAQAARHVAEHQPAAAATALERIEIAGAEAMVAMRQMVGSLRSDSQTPAGGTWDDVHQLIADAIARGEPVRATIDPGLRDTTPALVPSVHRIIAESLTNVRRHARDVTGVDVAVLGRPDRLVVTVRNDGTTAAPAGPGTFGIVGMCERATSLGGSLLAGPAPGGGWVVHAELPMEWPR